MDFDVREANDVGIAIKSQNQHQGPGLSGSRSHLLSTAPESFVGMKSSGQAIVEESRLMLEVLTGMLSLVGSRKHPLCDGFPWHKMD